MANKRPRTALNAGTEYGSVPIVRTVPYSNGLRRFHVVFDAANRDAGTVANPTFYLTGFGNAVKHARVSVRRVRIPLTMPIGGGTFFAVGNITGAPGTLQCRLAEGLYQSHADIAAALQTALNAMDGLPGGVNFTVTYDSSAYKYNFTATGTGTANFNFQFDTSTAVSSPYAHRLLGFEDSSENTAVDGELTSTTWTDLFGGIHSIDVFSTMVQPRMWDSRTNSLEPVIEHLVFGRGAEWGDIIDYMPPNMTTFVVDDFSQISSVQFRLVDTFGEEIDLNDFGWSIELIVDPVDV